MSGEIPHARFDRAVASFLASHGYPVRDYVTTGNTPAAGIMGEAHPGEVAYSPATSRRLAALAGKFGKRVRLTPGDRLAVSTALHEGLHQMRYGRTPDDLDMRFEEAATEAATEDLLHIFTTKKFGQRLPPQPLRRTSYPADVKTLRQLSTFGSGSKSFRDRDARVWRRSFLHADQPARQRMIDEATTSRTAWGARTGR